MPKLPRRAWTLVVPLLITAFSTPAWAATASCSNGESTLSCRLHGLLSLLSAAAIILGTLLLLALVAAIWYYRRNRNKDLLPR